MDDYLLRKQLPLRQQADKPVLKYSAISTPLTRSVPLFSQSDIHSLKYGGISTPFREMPTRNAQINVESVHKVASPTSKIANPYARPLSAKELEDDLASTQSIVIPQRESNPNLSASGQSPNSYVPAPPYTATSGGNSVGSFSAIQTNSFMRPLSGIRKEHENFAGENVTPQKSGSGVAPRASILRPPSSPSGNDPSRPNSQTSSASRHSVTFAEPADSVDVPKDAKISNCTNTNEKTSVRPVSSVRKELVSNDKIDVNHACSEFMRKFALSEAATKAGLNKLPNSQVHVVEKEVMNVGSGTPPKMTSDSAANGKSAHMKTESTVKINAATSNDEKETVVKPPPAGSRSVSGSSQTINRIRNPRYTPTKPYNEVSDASGDLISSTNKDKTENKADVKKDSSVSNMIKQNLASTSLVHVRQPAPGSGKPPVAPPIGDAKMEIGMKKMPVTNTLTGTVFYHKGSKGEIQLHEQRPKADGAPSVDKKPIEKRMLSDDGEEWEDVEEEDDASCPGPNSERLPGDGEAFDEDFYDEDDGIDNLDDDVIDVSDGDESAYSIGSSVGLSRQSSARARVHSATKHLVNLTLKDGERPLTASRRPHSAKSDGEVQPALTQSLFTNVPPTINFVGDGEKVEQIPWDIRKTFKWRLSPITPNIVKHTIGRSGFRITKKNYDWLGCWGKHMKAQGFKTIRDYQKINHFPGSFQIGRKDRLWRNLSKMQVHFGKKEFGFFPQTYVLPFDMKLLKRAWEDGGTKQKWIIKPPASARGIGIKVIHKWTQIPKRRPVIVQRYLAKPFLINESKFDLRVYVYVTNYDPLRIYVFDDGLVRFASQKYSSSMKNLSNKFMHLTNYSINKRNDEYMPNTDETVCQGHKWGLKALWAYLKKQGINTALIWENIKDVVIKTILCADSSINSLIKSNVKRRYCIHELFGFDIFLDENLKPWILEVNISPSLHSNSQLDINIKGNMIKDLFNIAGFMVPDKVDVTPVPGGVENNEPSSEVCMDKRLWTQPLSNDERAKHTYYCQKHLDEGVQPTILDILTPDDLRMLIETLDEDSRKGQFQRVFPTATSSKYLKFFEQPRYYNLLLTAWMQKYNKCESRGLNLIDSFCKKGLHLESPTTDPSHQWVIPTNTPRTQSAPSVKSRVDADLRSNSSSSVSKFKKKLKKAHPSLTHSSSLSSINQPRDGLPPRPPLSGRSAQSKS